MEDLLPLTYQPLENGHIRVLEILAGEPETPLECHLLTLELIQPPAVPWTAISYTWGAIKGTVPIGVDGARLMVTENALSALR